MTAQNILFNDGWQFCLCDIGTELSALPGRHWYDVELPHDWLINDTSKLYETGEGWYRRSLPCSAEQLSGRVLLNFDGVYMNSTLFVNGKEAGSWTYGYSAFEHDITDFLHEGENELLLRVSHQSPNTRWYSGAGIFRDVMLKLRPAAYIGTNGVYIHSAPQPEGGWTTEVETDVVGEASDIRMLLEVFDPAGASMGGYGMEAHFDGGHEKFTASFNSTDPELWSVDDPMLYTLKISLYSGSELLDCVNETFGYRTAEFDPDRGFLLNGEPVKLHGVCMHHDLGALGSALNEAALARQLRIMKEMGVNAIRTSHNMPARQLVQLCDEMGLLVDSEAFDMWEKPKTEFDNHRFFTEHAERDVRSWIERDRNHPCIIMWSIGNEINDTIDPHGLDITKRLYEYVLKYDPKGNAAPTIGSNYMGNENAQKCSDVVKLAGYNYSEYLYDEHHAKYPDWVIYGSETASAVRSRGIYRFPAELPLLTGEDCQCSSLDNSVVGWGSSAMKSWRLDRDCPFCCGQFIWTGFDYIGEPTPYNTKNSYFGIVDTAGFPKDIYYFYQSVWVSPEQKKVLHIVPSYWDFIPGQEIDVLIYSNARDVELFLNGKSIGSHVMELETSQDMRAHFKVPFEPGVLRVVGHFADGSECSEVLHTPSDPAAVVMTSDKETLLADGRDIAFVEISTVDVNGIPVGNARNLIRVEVSGAGRLVGLDNGDSTDYDSYKGDNRRLFSGKLLAMIESTLEPGEITVRAYSEGLENAELRLVSENCGEVSGVSVVTENKFPAVCRAYTGEVPARLLLPEVDVNSFDPERRSAEIRAKLLPENCTYDDISWSVVRRNGVESSLAQVEGSGRSAVVTAKGDGEFFVRAMVHNGAEHPQVIADIPFTAEGLGAAVRDAYSFISASTLDSSNVPTNIIEDGALSNFDGRTVMTYSDIDFGKTGSQIISLSVGTCFDMPVEVWEGTPDDGKLICRVDFGNNGHWCGFAGQDFALAERLTGVRTISVVIDSRVIFGGFSFVPIERAYDTNWVGEADSVYGDDYRIDGRRVADIGNNVIINYEGLDFGEGGSEALIISGETGNPMNQIQLRYTPAGGAQKTVLLEFQQDGGREQRFDIPKLSGVNDVSFVFMPGSRFDFDWFRFE
ncbi:glycoside hydrolase family 2 TIM barrel-domain containing protein [Ruminococcus callidus]|uniref:glycoside hydrolase family 2 TIM barrel-domain containing protein n=1 Tax=Ruminococcus callidus TaxID=40519 RepID=UPI0023F6815B|nr:glycoside hydrolase family 2 TIM barrel-domain containing protein [Ruminococcus callidus]